VLTNCYHGYSAHAAFGGYKKSGIGRETPVRHTVGQPPGRRRVAPGL
jgi:acyl-CoA reductase-like NAD-dependent aldehyde dehydrogenase